MASHSTRQSERGSTISKKLSTILLVTFIFYGLSCQTLKHKRFKQYTIEQFMDTISIRDSSFSHDEKNILFSSNESGIYNAYTIPVKGGKPTQITDSKEEPIWAISFLPKDNRILFRSDKGGNEIGHIFLRDIDGTIKDLTPDNDLRSVFYGWSYDEQSFFFGSNKRDRKFMDVYEMNIADFSGKMIYQNDRGFDFGGISNDKKYMALVKPITTNNADVFLYNLITKELKHITPHEGEIYYYISSFSVDSKYLYYLTDENHEFTHLKRYDINTQEHVEVKKVDWDIMYAYFSRNGKYRVIGINNDARTKIEVYDTTTEQYVELPKFPDADITSINISKSEELMAFYVNGSRSPDNLFVYNFNTKKYRQLTDTMNPEINADNLVDGQIVRYRSFDDLEIPAILYKPHDILPGRKAPALVVVHGGPGGQSRIGYSPRIQYLVNHGYVILQVNNRGSSGYGKTFFRLDDMKHGEDDLDDCVEAKKLLISTEYVDEHKIAIFGSSYGGYMVLAALAFRPDEFAAGVDGYGISNWVRTLENIPPWWEAYKESIYTEMGNPKTDKEYLYRISPLFHANNIRKPLMVLQGANDPRVLKKESDDIVEAVRKNNVPVKYIVFEDEGHGFRKKENEIRGRKEILKFLDEHLK